MTATDEDDNTLIACADLVSRAGAAGFEIGYLHDDVPVEQAGWWATAQYRGAEITVADRRSPADAAMALAERLLRGATCRCGLPVALSVRPWLSRRVCHWELIGARWEPGCDVPPISVDARRGDLAAMDRAMRRRKAG